MALSRKRKIATVTAPDHNLLQITPEETMDTDSDTRSDMIKKARVIESTSNDFGLDLSRYQVWSVEEVVSYMKMGKLDKQVCSAFQSNRIRGNHLLELKEDDLYRMGISAIGDQLDVLQHIRKLRKPSEHKVFNDPIHGHIEIHPLLVAIIDTPQFQRLRHLKQLGGGYYVFPGASHNRFEHSLGVSYLAGEFVESIQKRQPELEISDVDILCIKMAGLCHDLGHGPFSHMFDSLFIPRLSPPGTKWRHEDGSIKMFDHLVKENNLMDFFRKFGITDEDLIFVKEVIAGPISSCGVNNSVDPSELPIIDIDGDEEWKYKGRPEEKSFLYEIVANKRNGIDVDKWDYFARDCHCLGIPNNFDLERFMKFARVIKVKRRRQICARDKEVNNLYELFHTRNSLHRRAYQHKTSNIVELMITEALVKANDHILIPGTNGKLVKMSESIHDMTAYTRLNDSILQLIMMSTDPSLEESKRLLRMIEKRQLYKCVGQTQPSRDLNMSEEDILGQLAKSIDSNVNASQLTREDFLVQVVTFDYGMKDKNPVDEMRFYVKSKPDKAVKVRRDQVSQMLPRTFKEKSVRVYCKNQDPSVVDAARRHFISWCAMQKQFITPKGYLNTSHEDEGTYCDDVMEDDEEDEPSFTPYGTPFGTPMKGGISFDNGSPSASSNHEDTIEAIKKKLLFQESSTN